MTTYFQTLMHLIKSIIGAGIFSMGIAFKNAGMGIAIILTPVVGLVVLHCARTVVSVVEYKRSDEKSSTYLNDSSSYADVVERVFLDGPSLLQRYAKYVKVFVNVAICFMNLGFCCIYVVFVGSNMRKVLEYFGIYYDIHIIMLIFIVPMWLSSLITNLKWLSPVSAIANLILVVAIGITMYFTCEELPPLSSVNYVTGIESIPLFFGVALYTFECIALIIPLRNEMDQPKKLASYFGVLNVGFLIIIPLVLCIGFFSYLKYGDNIQGTVFLNLPQNSKLVQSLIILVCIQILFTYPVQMYAPVTIMWPMIVRKFGPFKRPMLPLLCFRTALVIVTLIIGEAIPFIDLIISLVGAICSTWLTLFIPSLMNILIFYNLKTSTLQKTLLVVKNSTLALIAIVIFVTGVYTSIRDIIAAF